MSGPRRARILAVLALVLAAASTAPAAVPPPPPRVVSLNPCLDAILLEVADPRQILALSHYAHEPTQSAVAAAARRLPFTFGSAEEVLALGPDLVLTGGEAAALGRVLPRLHIREARFGVPASVAASEAQVRDIAALVGHPERGRLLNARIEAALRAGAPPPGARRLRALVFEAHGFASGPHTLMDELMRRSGFENAAARYGLDQTMDVPLERLLADPPEVLLAGRLAPGVPDWADRVLSHPALGALKGRMRQESFPEPLLFCGGPVIILAVKALAAARERAMAGVSQ